MWVWNVLGLKGHVPVKTMVPPRARRRCWWYCGCQCSDDVERSRWRTYSTEDIWTTNQTFCWWTTTTGRSLVVWLGLGLLLCLSPLLSVKSIKGPVRQIVLEYFHSDISGLESLLPRSVRTTLAQLHSGHCRLLKAYMARVTTGVSDVCPECGVAPHSVEHLFNCSAHPTQLTVQDLWDNPAEVADFLNLDSWRQWTRREELLGYHNNNKLCRISCSG